MEYILTTDRLTKCFGKKTAVDQVSVHVRKGDIYGLIGRNGAGKTTFLRMVAGLIPQSKGDMTLFGQTNGSIRTSHSLRKVGTLIEAPGILGTLTAADNLRLKCICAGIKKPDDYIQQLLQLVGLGNTGKLKAGHFSLGMKQRLGIALALVGDPELLVLDEPINGLDPQGIAEVREVIRRLHSERELTILISSHILEELSKIATNYAIIENGRLVTELTHEQLREQCSNRIVIHMDQPMQVIPVFRALGIEQYRIVDDSTVTVMERIDDTPQIIFALSEAKVPIRTINIEGMAIEDFFFSVTGGANHG